MKKIWKILENQEKANDYYAKKSSLLFDCYAIPEAKKKTLEAIQSNLALHESIVDEFDRDGYDVGNVVLQALSGFVFDVQVGIAKKKRDTKTQLITLLQEPVYNSYYRLYAKVTEKIAKWQEKNKGKTRGTEAIENERTLDDIAGEIKFFNDKEMEATMDYLLQLKKKRNTSVKRCKRDEVERIDNEVQNIKNNGMYRK